MTARLHNRVLICLFQACTLLHSTTAATTIAITLSQVDITLWSEVFRIESTAPRWSCRDVGLAVAAAAMAAVVPPAAQGIHLALAFHWWVVAAAAGWTIHCAGRLAEILGPAGIRDPVAIRCPAGIRDPAAVRDPAGIRDPAAARGDHLVVDRVPVAGAPNRWHLGEDPPPSR